jgi:hypothetical protein
MASSVSGADDYAQNLYYSHTQYNDSNVAIQSNKTELLSTQMMQNQSNYNVAIDKLKISSLDGVILSYFPQNKLKLGLQLTNNTNTSKYEETFLLKTGLSVFIPQLEHFYCSYTNNSNIVNVFNSSGFTLTITLPRLPIKVFYNSVNNFLYYHDNYVIYSYDITNTTDNKEDDTTFINTGIRCMDYNEITNNLVFTSGSLSYTQYSVIPETGRITISFTFSTATLINITAIQCGVSYIYVLNNSDINYISPIQILNIFNLTGNLLLQVNVSAYNVIREMENRFEDNLFNLYSEGTMTTTPYQGGGYIPPLTGIGNGAFGATTYMRVLPALLALNDTVIGWNTPITGNMCYNQAKEIIYQSYLVGNSYVLQIYTNQVNSQAGDGYTINTTVPSVNNLLTNVYNANTYYSKYISFMNLNSQDYLFSSVFLNPSTIQIYSINLDSAIPASTNYTFYSSTVGSISLNINTLIAPSKGGLTQSTIEADTFSNIVPGFIGNNLTPNIAFGTNYYYYVDNVNTSIIYKFQYGNSTPVNTFNLTTIFTYVSIVEAITTDGDACFVIFKQELLKRYMIVNLENTTITAIITSYYIQPAFFTSFNAVENYTIINYNINMNVYNNSYYVIFDGGFNIYSNAEKSPPATNDFAQLIPLFSGIGGMFNATSSSPNTFIKNSIPRSNPLITYTLRNNEILQSFLGYDFNNNVLVLSLNSITNIYYVNAFSMTSSTLVYYFASNNRILAISQMTPVAVPAIPAEWQLYQQINPVVGEFDTDYYNNGYPLNDNTATITIDEYNNMLLTYCSQQDTLSGQGTYYTVQLTPPAIVNNTLFINIAPYTPSLIQCNYNNGILGNSVNGSLENYNLMYDRNMKCYYARSGDILLKGFLDNVNLRINFINYFDFTTLTTNDPHISVYASFLCCLENVNFPDAPYKYNPSTTTLQYIASPLALNTRLSLPQSQYVDPVLGYNVFEKFYIFSSTPNNNLNYYTYDGSNMNLNKTITIRPFTKMSSTFGYSISPVVPQSQLAVYSLQEYIDSINNAFIALFSLINSNGFTSTTTQAPNVSINWQTGFLTLNYDSAINNVNNGIFVNNALLSYMAFQASPSAIPFLSNKYVLNSTGTNTQSKLSFFKFNTVDKIVVNSSMSIIGDQTGSNTQSICFSDLDINLSDSVFLNMSGSFIYAPTLLRLYTLVSNEGLRRINYSVMIRYLDKTELPFMIQENQNVSIKFIFQRIY